LSGSPIPELRVAVALLTLNFCTAANIQSYSALSHLGRVCGSLQCPLPLPSKNRRRLRFSRGRR
jgi:hypothetical protein